LDQETIQIVKQAKHLWEKIFPLLERFHSDKYDSLDLTFSDLESAKAAVEAVATFRHYQDSLEYLSQAPKGDPFVDIDELLKRKDCPDEMFYTICIPFNDFLPEEYESILTAIDTTVLHYMPLYSRWIQSLERYIQTYDSLEIVNYSFPVRDPTKNDWKPTGHDLHALHHSLLAVAKQLIATSLNAPPIYITIEGTVKKLIVSVNGKALQLAPMQVRGVAALAQLEYNHWFSLKDFCGIAFPDFDADLLKDFDAALSVLKQFEPFGWDTDIGIRRIKGAVIKSLVDVAVLRAYLAQKKKA
jgi:hypothetical protein